MRVEWSVVSTVQFHTSVSKLCLIFSININYSWPKFAINWKFAEFIYADSQMIEWSRFLEIRNEIREVVEIRDRSRGREAKSTFYQQKTCYEWLQCDA